MDVAITDQNAIPTELIAAFTTARDVHEAAVFAQRQGTGSEFAVTAARREMAAASDALMHARRAARIARAA